MLKIKTIEVKDDKSVKENRKNNENKGKDLISLRKKPKIFQIQFLVWDKYICNAVLKQFLVKQFLYIFSIVKP